MNYIALHQTYAVERGTGSARACADTAHGLHSPRATRA